MSVPCRYCFGYSSDCSLLVDSCFGVFLGAFGAEEVAAADKLLYALDLFHNVSKYKEELLSCPVASGAAGYEDKSYFGPP